ncbi:MAG: diguanylate cyclase [Zoogloeaceae bacterium]|nr:diguanylate cyclase [Zoogloeaceae bacterium]
MPERFVEFILQINNLTDTLSALALRGPLFECRRLEKESLALFDVGTSHPVDEAKLKSLGKRIEHFCSLLQHYLQKENPQQDRRVPLLSAKPEAETGNNHQRISLCLMSTRGAHWQDLVTQLSYFGFHVLESTCEIPEVDNADPGIYLLDLEDRPENRWKDWIQNLRKRRPMSRIITLAAPEQFFAMHTALKAGADICLSKRVSLQHIMAQVLAQHTETEQESFRVLVMEDSPTNAYAIRQALESNGIAVEILHDPLESLKTIRHFQPDLILMDMYLRECTGVDVARVIRLHDEFLSIPIIYLSSETNVALQVEALRLGGDQFLTKPFNPVLLNAVIKSKIERYRSLRSSMRNDSLTGLLNHISSKQALAATLGTCGEKMSIVMLDIDHFKQVNDRHGHLIGDQVIRSLAWLLKQRMRHTDIIGRYGGEEFVLGLPDIDSEEAVEVINRIREDFSRIPFKGASGVVFRVTLSAGIAMYSDAMDTLTVLLERADAALYEAKHQGRNRLILAQGTPIHEQSNLSPLVLEPIMIKNAIH